MKKTVLYMRLLLAVIVATLVGACASMGRPEGGPRDETPPVFVRSNPSPGQVRVDKNKIVLEFDENISLDDQTNKVVVSPAQKTTPYILAAGKKITIELRDTMLPNTTYTLDFSDAIVDLNERNPIDGFAFDFATGDTIDTLRISGMVFEAATLEPAQGMLVGVYSNLSDTAVTTLPLERITKTNQLGQFTVRNLKPGNYRIFAINDVNRDYKWDRSEDVAFYDVLLSPQAANVAGLDTLKNAEGQDSIVERMNVEYTPNDVLLTWFNENYQSQYLAKYERPERHLIDLKMGAKSDSLPQIRILNGERAGEPIERWSVLKASATLDSLTYWITDSVIIRQDSIQLETRYLHTDSLENLTWQTDTLNFNMKVPKKKAAPKDPQKEAEKDKLSTDSTAVTIQLMNIKLVSGTTQEPETPLVIETQHPVRSFDASGVKMEMFDDTVWVEIAPPKFARTDSLNPMRYVAEYEWEHDTKYRLSIDSMAVVGIYDQYNGNQKFEISTRPIEEYSTITFDLTNLPTGAAFVELLNASDKPVRKAKVEGSQAVMKYVLPGTYYARLIDDRNGNLLWDTGNLLDSVQPEDVYYFPKKINLKKNWELSQPWNLTELPVDKQKPQEIKKNKPKLKPGEQEEYYYDEDEDEDYFDNFGGNNRRGNSGRYNDGFGGGRDSFRGGGNRGNRGSGLRGGQFSGGMGSIRNR